MFCILTVDLWEAKLSFCNPHQIPAKSEGNGNALIIVIHSKKKKKPLTYQVFWYMLMRVKEMHARTTEAWKDEVYFFKEGWLDWARAVYSFQNMSFKCLLSLDSNKKITLLLVTEIPIRTVEKCYACLLNKSKANCIWAFFLYKQIQNVFTLNRMDYKKCSNLSKVQKTCPQKQLTCTKQQAIPVRT